jgi:thioredoxin 1
MRGQDKVMRTIGMRTVLAMAFVSSAAAFLQPTGMPALRGARAATCSSPALRRASAVHMGKVESVTAEAFEVALQTEDLPMIVDFYTTWCGPCKLIAPQLEKVAEEYQDKVKIVKIDTDIESDLASSLQVFAMPTLLFIKDGKIRQRAEGAMLAPKIKDLAEHIFFDGPEPTWEWMGKVASANAK